MFDKYLTKEPEDNFTPYCEKVLENISDDVYSAIEEKNFDQSHEENAFLSYLFNIGLEPKKAAEHLTIFFKSIYFEKWHKDYYKNKIYKLK